MLKKLVTEVEFTFHAAQVKGILLFHQKSLMKTVTYGAIGTALNMPALWGTLSAILCRIGELDHEQDRVPLSCLAVNKFGRPGVGFWLHMAELGIRSAAHASSLTPQGEVYVLTEEEEDWWVAQVTALGIKNWLTPTWPQAFQPVCEPLASILKEYDSNAAPGLQTSGNASKFRLIKIKGWPSTIHYEFTTYNDGYIGVELHLESDECARIAPQLQGAVQHLQSRYPTITWDPKWSAGRGRLVVRMDEKPAAVIADTMKSFIADTCLLVDQALAALTV